jgi:chemotaxis protein histidine kinase CheA
MTDELTPSIEQAAKRAFIEHSGKVLSEALSFLGSSDDCSRNTLEGIARVLHLVKGGAAFLKYREIVTISENLEQFIRKGLVAPSRDLPERTKERVRYLADKIGELCEEI